jgi:hypothetical protein
MKYTSVLLVASAQAYNLNNQENLYRATRSLEESSLVQLEESKILETSLPNWNGWHPHMDEFPGTVNEFGNYMDPYTRVVPNRFVGDAAMEGVPPVDKFTQNLITNYATEGFEDKKHPKPSGKFYINRANAKKVAAEVACTHFKMCGADAEAWLASSDLDRFNKAFDHFDVNHENQLDAVGVSTFFRYLYQPLGWVDLQ